MSLKEILSQLPPQSSLLASTQIHLEDLGFERGKERLQEQTKRGGRGRARHRVKWARAPRAVARDGEGTTTAGNRAGQEVEDASPAAVRGGQGRTCRLQPCGASGRAGRDRAANRATSKEARLGCSGTVEQRAHE